MGEEILSGAYARREEQAALEIAQLKALLTKADAQVGLGNLRGETPFFRYLTAACSHAFARAVDDVRATTMFEVLVRACFGFTD